MAAEHYTLVVNLFSIIPKGFRNKAQGCEERATLGNRRTRPQPPTGLRPRYASKFAQKGDTTPLGLILSWLESPG